jgi:amino acid permease
VKDQFYTSPTFIVLILALCEVPFTLVSKIEKLKFMAFLGVVGITVFVISLVITFFTEMPERDWNCSS